MVSAATGNKKSGRIRSSEISNYLIPGALLLVGILLTLVVWQVMRQQEIDKSRVEFELLLELLREAGKIVKKEDLSERVLGRSLSPFDRSLDMHISNVRKKLGQRADGSERIKTIRSVGYIYTVV